MEGMMLFILVVSSLHTTSHNFVLVLDPDNAGQKVTYELVRKGGVMGSGQV